MIIVVVVIIVIVVVMVIVLVIILVVPVFMVIMVVVIPVNGPLVLAVTMPSPLMVSAMMLAVEAAVVLAEVATMTLAKVSAVVARVEIRAVIMVERQEWGEVLSVVAVVMAQAQPITVMAVAVPVNMTVPKTVTTITAKPIRRVVSERVGLVIWPIVERSFGSVVALVISLVGIFCRSVDDDGNCREDKHRLPDPHGFLIRRQKTTQ